MLRDGEPVRLGLKQQQLLTVLMLFAGRPVSADLLVDCLWEESLPSNPLNSLQDLVRRLRTALGDFEHRIVVTEGRSYRLEVPPERLDVKAFERLVRAGVALAVDAREPATSRKLLARAVKISDGEVPDARPGSPVDRELEKIQTLSIAATRLASGIYEVEPGSLPPAGATETGLAVVLPELEDLVLADLLVEILGFGGRLRRFENRVLVASLPGFGSAVRAASAVSDRMAAARLQLRGAICRLDGVDELWRYGNLLALLSTASSGRILVAADCKSAVRAAGIAGLLRPYSGEEPRQMLSSKEILELVDRHLTPLEPPIVGREELLRQITELLERSRLVTLRGPGGIGKTRAAWEVGRRLAGRFRDGVCFVDLAEADDHGGPLLLIMRTLGTPSDPYVQPEDSLIGVFRDAERLLILDNCEGFGDEVRTLCEALVAAAPSVAVLVTSRSALGATQEHVCDVGELDLADAAQLLVSLAYPEESPSPPAPTDPLVLGLCSLLDNVPLAIECVASMVRSMGLQATSAALKAVPDGAVVPLLDATYRGRGRHRSIELALNASCSTLESSDLALFECLSSLRGAFGTEDARGVMPSREHLDVAAGLERLCDASLVKAAGDNRWRLLEPVRQFGATRLMRKGDHFSQAARHAGHFISLAAQAESQLTGVEAKTWLGRLTEVYPNLDKALSWTVEAGDAVGAMQLTSSLWWYWAANGMFIEGARAVERALALEGAVPEHLRVKTLVAVSYLSWWAGNPRRTESSLSEAMEIIGNAGPSDSAFRILKAWSHTGLAAARFWGGGDYPSLHRQLETGRELFVSAADLPGLGLNLSTHSGVAWHYGHDVIHHRKALESLEVFRRAGHQTMIAHMQRVVGLATARLGDLETGRALLLDGLEASEAMEDFGGLPLGYAFLGLVETWAADRDGARSAFRDSIDANRSLGQLWPSVLALSFGAEEACRQKRYADSVRLQSASESVTEKTRIGLAPAEKARALRAASTAVEHLDPHDVERLRTEGADTPLRASVSLAREVIGGPA